MVKEEERSRRMAGKEAERKASPAARPADGDFDASAGEEEEVPDTGKSRKTAYSPNGQLRPMGRSRAPYLLSLLGI